MVKPIFDKRFTILVLLQILMTLGIVATIFFNSQKSSLTDLTDKYREVASELQAAGLNHEALSFYEKYWFESANADKDSIAFSLGQLYENALNFERALAWYYLVDLVNPNSKYITEASKKKVSLLEKLGKTSAAKRELVDSSALEKKKRDQDSQVVAEIGTRQIFLNELDEFWDELPPEIKQKNDKKQLLSKLVADEVLYQKALRLGLEDDLNIKKKIELMKKQFLIQHILNEELKMNVEEQDLKNHFEVNKDKFKIKAKAKIVFIKTKSKEEVQKIQKNIKKGLDYHVVAKELGQGDLKESEIFEGESFLRYKNEVVREIFKLKPKEWSAPQLLGGEYTLFYMISKEEAQIPTYHQIKNQVENDYRMTKSQKKYEELIQKSLSGDEIKIYSERVK